MYYVANFPYYAVVEHMLPYVVVQLTKFVPYELKVGRQHAVPTVSMHQKAGEMACCNLIGSCTMSMLWRDVKRHAINCDWLNTQNYGENFCYVRCRNVRVREIQDTVISLYLL